VEASNGGFKVRVLKRAKFVDEEKCNACGKCSEKCPVTIPDELDARIGGTRKLASVAFPQAVPNINYVNILCRQGKMRDKGACIGACVVDCSQCRECGVALCVKACRDEGKGAIELWMKDEWVNLEVKSIVVATGVKTAEIEEGTWGLDEYPNVISYMNFERLMNSGGPTLGEIVRPSDGHHAHKIAWIQCAGRGDKGLNYCSKVCCMVAAKQTIITKEHDADVECFVFYNHQTCYGKGFDEFYKKASALGVNYVIGKPFDVREDPETNNLILKYEDEVEGVLKEVEVELLVLSTGLEPNDRNEKLAKVLKIELDHNGFFKEIDPINAPLEATVPGIYLCGGATGPIDISESVVQATGASMKAVSKR
jgi:heterodisulfide reductase subunit A